MANQDLLQRLEQVISEIILETRLYHNTLKQGDHFDRQAAILDRLEELRTELTSIRTALKKDGENLD